MKHFGHEPPMSENSGKRHISVNKPGIFTLGLLIGILLSYGYRNIPIGFGTEIQPVSEINTGDIDPFADFEIPTNNRVKARLKNYLRAGPQADLLQTYKNSGRYLPLIQAVFEDYNLPQFLGFLPVIESRFLANSRSPAGAVGIWQLMPATARDYGLKINRWIDERRDPEKSTVVAAEFLQFLYSKLGDWDLVLAAYNCGYPKLRRIMRREKTTNYWELQQLPRETYNFVPKFYAVLHIFASPEKHGVQLPGRIDAVSYETIDIEATFSLDQIARLANVSPTVIKEFNPALTADIAPSGKYSIRVPVGVKEHFMEQFESNPPDQVEITYATYRVKRGDTLARIAEKFGTTVHAIQADNNLRSSRWINAGMKLQIATIDVVKDTMSEESILEIAEKASAAGSLDQLRFSYRVERRGLSLGILARYYRVNRDEITAWNPSIKGKTLQKGQKLKILKPRENVTYHRIRRGDSLWRLARRYTTSVSNLRRWNQIRGSRIYPGDMLIVALK